MMVKLSSTGPLAPVFDYVGDREREELCQDIRTTGLGLSSQLRWRFLEYDDFPYQWARMCHPKMSNEVCIRDFYGREECCGRKEFCGNVKKYA